MDSEMCPAELMFIRKAFIKERDLKVFRKYGHLVEPKERVGFN
jgi:hypothetical protein